MEVSGVLKGSVAESAGFKPGDIILSIDKKPLKEKEDLRSTVFQHKVGDRITLDVYRKNKHLSLEVTLKEKAAGPGPEGRSEQPEEQKAAWLGMTVIDLTEELAQKLETPDATGAVVVAVDPDSPAGTAGVQPYDVIQEVEQMAVAGLKDFNEIRKRIGDKAEVLLLVERQGSTMYIVVSKEKKGPAE
jgi:serine protease Do